MAAPECVTLGRQALQHLRLTLERQIGTSAASVLQEAGFASGESIYNAFEAWLGARYGVSRPQDLDAEYLGEALSAFFNELGWGTLTLGELGPSVMLVDAPSWAESWPGAAQYPSCHVSSGVLADVFSRMSGGQFAAMEVECRSKGDHHCRFLLAAPETLMLVYERMTHGLGYRQALGAA